MITLDSNPRDIFKRVMAYATERALAEGTEEAVMAALFDALNGPIEDTDDESAETGAKA
jgi:hypothetical protein